jgi:riboflavin transporter FmnP
MGLAFNFLLTLLIELPIIVLFFKRKKRKEAALMAVLINIVSWSIAHIIFFSSDLPLYYVAIGLAIGEASAFNLLLECNWKKAIPLALLANTLSFFITQQIPIDIEIFQQKQEIIQNEQA